MTRVSVIIPVYNEEKVIGACIESLLGQTYSDLEIIIVDDGSTDDTIEIVNALKVYKVLEQKHEGPGMARNLGAKHARGSILVFVDADMTFDKDFIDKLVEPIVSGKTQGTFSKEEYVSNWDNIWAKCWNINENWLPERRHPKNYPNEQPVFRAIVRTEFEKVGGFDKGGYTDDWSLARKLGYLAISAPEAIFYHKNPDTLREIFHHAKWVGKREYKFGLAGIVFALLRSSFPVSLIVGIFKSFSSGNLAFLVFKSVYDLGIFIGILEAKVVKKLAK